MQNDQWQEPRAAVTVDLAIFTVRDAVLQVLLVTRAYQPYRGRPALPGGYVLDGETLDEAAVRELTEETGIDGRQLHLEQLRTFGDPGRDPRGRVVTVAYLALGPDLPAPQAGTDAKDAFWRPVDRVLAEPGELAFDHAAILREALEKARWQLEYTTVAAQFCPDPFTVGDLRQVYEAVWGIRLDPSNFRRKVTRAGHFIKATGGFRVPPLGRPAALYTRGPDRLLYPPLLRSGEVARQQIA
jgi:8-oxo-dGTP diphosphatase